MEETAKEKKFRLVPGKKRPQHKSQSKKGLTVKKLRRYAARVLLGTMTTLGHTKNDVRELFENETTNDLKKAAIVALCKIFNQQEQLKIKISLVDKMTEVFNYNRKFHVDAILTKHESRLQLNSDYKRMYEAVFTEMKKIIDSEKK